MAYSRFYADWVDFPLTTTPIVAAAMDNIEAGILATSLVADAALPETVINAKGDLIAGTANDTADRLAVGADNSVLIGSAAAATGLAWTADLPVASLASGSESQVLTTTGGVPTWATASSGVPAGTISAYAGSAAPSGYLLCDGSAVSRTGQAALFAVCGTTYGSGDGSTTFNLPDIRGRVPVGLGTNASVDTLGESDGVALALRRPQHRHTPHTHGGGFNNSFSQQNGFFTTGFGVGNETNTDSADGGSGVATDSLDAPAHLVLNFIIKT